MDPLAPQGSRGAAVPKRDTLKTRARGAPVPGRGPGRAQQACEMGAPWPGGRGMRGAKAIAGSHRDHGRPTRPEWRGAGAGWA